MNACTRRSVFIWSKYFLTSPIFRIARDAELQILVVSRPMSVLTQTHIFQWWSDVGNRELYKLILKVNTICCKGTLPFRPKSLTVKFSTKISNIAPWNWKKGALLRYKHVIAFVWRHIRGKIAYWDTHSILGKSLQRNLIKEELGQ